MLNELIEYENINKNFKDFSLISSNQKTAIYSCIYKKTNKKVVLKVLKKSNVDNKEKNRFKNECNLLKKINSENVIRMIGYFFKDDELYYAMEFFEFGTLRDLIKKQRLSFLDIVGIAIKICIGLRDIHNLNIIHRDLKPSNILVDLNKSILKIIDFGISINEVDYKVENSNKVIGSIHYLAPELILQSSRITKQVDIYAFGIILFEMICGHPPFYSNDYKEIMLNQINKNIPKLSNLDNKLLNQLQNIIDKCTKKNPLERYNDCNEIISDLKACLVD
ncbi:serine/threonine-protein kinase [Metamycoplasma auris]|uniref:Serine/threonine-protein kinase n=1 Tax=Metamycoplasma auris TaxID=51363 RepID=A0A2W7HXB0_9BACT|nr:serine/threonine-protein kinase [Metamycoplasma auris]PZV99835.1 serine/threonine-protein kinase [Metamycoplasma auris]